MARGITRDLVCLNNNLDFNVYIYNVQPDYVFDYNNGRAKIDRNMVVNQ